MVKQFLLFLLAFSFLHASSVKSIKAEDALNLKIKSLINPATFVKDRAYINVIFSPRSSYYKSDGRVDSVKVVQTLKENGLLNLFFKKPREINIDFKTKATPLFFVKIMSDSLRNIGYYKYVTKESSFNESEFIWKISLISEYAADPMILNQELKKSGCEILDVSRQNETNWSYTIDMSSAKLDVILLKDEEELRLKRSLYSYWLDVSKIEKIKIYSPAINNWYPYIAYYDKNLKLLKLLKLDVKKINLTIDIPQDTQYLKISDSYNLKNIKDDLVLKPLGRKIDIP